MQSTEEQGSIWTARYGYVCPLEQGKVVPIKGVGKLDSYNPVICEDGTQRLLAFRLEERASSVFAPAHYHPKIAFASQQGSSWQLVPHPAPLDMLEDPTFLRVTISGKQQVILGGVRVSSQGLSYDIQTEFYIGDSLASLSRTPFAIIRNMKDVRLLQLPNGRFLLCRRPRGDEFGEGRITLHLLDDLSQLPSLDNLGLPTLAILDSGFPNDWVGTNNAYLIHDQTGEQWVGLLSHLALRDVNDGRHYAVTTYKIRLADLREDSVQSILPNVIATRSCFEHGPSKTHALADVVFPGSLEALGDERYRLWAGLSDARVGTVIVDDPFRLGAPVNDRQLSAAA